MNFEEIKKTFVEVFKDKIFCKQSLLKEGVLDQEIVTIKIIKNEILEKIESEMNYRAS